VGVHLPRARDASTGGAAWRPPSHTDVVLIVPAAAARLQPHTPDNTYAGTARPPADAGLARAHVRRQASGDGRSRSRRRPARALRRACLRNVRAEGVRNATPGMAYRGAAPGNRTTARPGRCGRPEKRRPRRRHTPLPHAARLPTDPGARTRARQVATPQSPPRCADISRKTTLRRWWTDRPRATP
jgi:hypothetical protein